MLDRRALCFGQVTFGQRMVAGYPSTVQTRSFPACALASGHRAFQRPPARSPPPSSLIATRENTSRDTGRSVRGRGRCSGYPTLRTTVWPSRWSSSAARAHAVVVSVLTPAEILIAARRLAGARPHLAAVAGIVHHEDLWQLCRDELTGVDVRIDGWDIRGRWFGVVVGATPRLGELRRGETIPWRVIAAQIAPRERRGSR